MKTQTGIWIDGARALIISLHNGKEIIHELTSDIENRVHHSHEGDKGSFMGPRHINNEKKFDERHHHQVKQYLGRVLDEVKQCDELFVMGPAEMKTELKKKIEEDRQLQPKLRGVETAGQLTVNQCVARVKEFFLQ